MGYFLLGVLIGWLVPRPKFIGKAEIAIWSPIKKKLPKIKDMKKVLYDLQKFYKDRGIVLREIDNTWFFETADDISDYLKEHKVVRKKLSKAAMETLSIIGFVLGIVTIEVTPPARAA